MEKRIAGQWRGCALPLCAALTYTLVAVITTHPLWLHLTDSLPSDIGDPLLNTWIQAWDARALLTNPLTLFDANVFYPLRNTLAYSEHLASTAALVLPLQLVTGEPLVAYNLSLLLSFPLAGLGMYLLVLRWTRQHGAAFLAGLAFAFAPYRLASIAHLQLLTVQWLPFSVLALDRLLGHGGSKDGFTGRVLASGKWHRDIALFVVFTTLQILASWYLAVFAALILALYTMSWFVARWYRGDRGRALYLPLAHLAIASVFVACLTLPFALPYLDVLPQLQAARPVTWAVSFAAQPTDLMTAAPFLRIPGTLTRSLAERSGFTEENTLFLGLVTLLLALVGLVRGRPRWRLAALLAIVAISLTLTFAGPYRALTQLFPPLAVIRVPPRWIIPATFALAALVGYGLQSVRSPALKRIVLMAASLLLVAESFSAPLPLASVGSMTDLPPVYYGLSTIQQQSPGAVVELPMHVAPAPEFPETKRMYASTRDWWGLVNGYSGFTPDRQVELGEKLADFPAEQALAALRTLAASGVRYLVVHPDEAPLDRDRWDADDRWQVERQTTLLPMGRFGPDELYLINPYGDRLVTDPTAISDAYWSGNEPAATDIRFAPSQSSGDIRLLAYLYQSEDAREALWSGPGATNAELAAAGTQSPKEARLTLYWQTSMPLDTDYTVFVHSVNTDGQLIGQADGPPVANHYPTTVWRPDEIVQDSRLVPAGARYLIGLYDWTTGERLPAFAADGTRLPDDAFVIVANGP